jgi:hypothetical protein
MSPAPGSGRLFEDAEIEVGVHIFDLECLAESVQTSVL